MTRLERRNYTNEQLNLKDKGGMFDLLDNVIKTLCRMTDEEFNHYCDIATDEELDLLISEKLTYAQKRQLIIILTTKVYKQWKN